MKKGQKIKIIDESIKLYSWGTKHQNQQEFSQTDHLPTYAQDLQDSNQFQQHQPIKPVASELDNLQVGFLKLKNEQIQKLRDLRSEYDEIKKIATDYVIPNASGASSVTSSSASNSGKSPFLLSPTTPKQNNKKLPTGREVKIIMLQKKQIEAMLENSMKKIEQLLHNEMQFKKIIHELKLQRDSKKFDEDEHLYTSQFLRKKQKDTNEHIQELELERQNLISILNSTKEKAQFLQVHLSKSEKQLKKILDQKRNFEEILRIEKDKYLNLELQSRRNKREYEILEKDKDAEINRLLKLKELKEGTAQLEGRNAVMHLQEELKVTQKRYTLLIQQFQKCLQQRDKQKKQQQVKIMNEFINKTANDPQSKALQDTITSILERVHQLENKPIDEIEDIIKHEQQMELQITRLNKENQSLSKELSEKAQENERLFNQNCSLKATLQNRERKVAVLQQNESDLKTQMQKFKNYQRTVKREKSMSEFKNQYRSPKLQKFPESNISNISEFDARQRVKPIEKQKEVLKTELASLSANKQSLQQQNRELRLQVLRLKFQVQKSVKEGQFCSNLLTKTHQSERALLIKQIEALKGDSNYSQQFERIVQRKNGEIQKWKLSVEMLQKKLSNLDEILRSKQNPELARTRSQQFKQLSQLMFTVQSLALQNEQYVKQRQGNQHLQQQNEKLKQLLRRSKSVTIKLNELWSMKQLEYQRINELIKPLTRQ